MISTFRFAVFTETPADSAGRNLTNSALRGFKATERDAIALATRYKSAGTRVYVSLRGQILWSN